MFWILKRSKFTANLFNSVLNNNILYKDANRSNNSKRSGYDRLTTTEDDPNGNISPPPIPLTAPPSSTVTTPSEGAEMTTPLSPLTPMTPSTTTDMDVTSTRSPSVIGSTSDFDHYMSQTDSDDSDVDEDEEDEDEDEDEDDEALTCNVCDRAFPTSRQLASHQTRKRHYGCSICENVFPTLMSLEAHKEESNHWSDDDLFLDDDDDDDLDDYYYDDEENEEEREQLL